MGGVTTQISIFLVLMISRCKQFVLFLTLVLASTFLTNCGKNLETFTNGTKSNYDLDTNDISYIQFYIDPGIRLRYDETTSESEVTRDNEVSNRIRKYEKTIDILPKTPGVATKIEGESIVVSFADDINLEFSPINSMSGTPYELKYFNGEEVDNQNYIQFRDRSYEVKYGIMEKETWGREGGFKTVNQTPVLLYRFKSEIDVDKEREVVKGRTIN